MRHLNSFMAPRPQLWIPAEEYLVIGEKKLTVEYPQKFILKRNFDKTKHQCRSAYFNLQDSRSTRTYTKQPKKVLLSIKRCHLKIIPASNRKRLLKSIENHRNKNFRMWLKKICSTALMIVEARLKNNKQIEQAKIKNLSSKYKASGDHWLRFSFLPKHKGVKGTHWISQIIQGSIYLF